MGIKKKKMIHILIAFVLSFVATFSTNINAAIYNPYDTIELSKISTYSNKSFSLSEIPEYTNQAYAIVNNNEPYYSEKDLTTTSYENYSELDYLGRCGVCIANIGQDIMPTEARGNIGSVKPTGWHSVRYDGVDGGYLYNRCHLIGFQLAGENANKKNLITGTRYLNVVGMLPFENMVADYVKETNNHVLYRVTPIFEGENLVANGVLIEAMSVEDKGNAIKFNVYCYNVQPGVTIDYATGESTGPEYNGSGSDTPSISTQSKYMGDANEDGKVNAADAATVLDIYRNNSATESQKIVCDVNKDGKINAADASIILDYYRSNVLITVGIKGEEEILPEEDEKEEVEVRYILNTNTKKFHLPTCSSASTISAGNRVESGATRDFIISIGYEPCKRCNP